ncbi:thiamine pyrophosphate-dependent enzyme [Nitrincola alkalilacustris]|uniref:thiamine pyrophosphate-dependent enzyme n=1 Tax=Nitrincola alkalilacustris TaxID=1571224 RepID=UPI00124C1FAE|nr:thiamine pyrophosphate-dependent enzyme [Nitrincola alkalilacustris]
MTTAGTSIEDNFRQRLISGELPDKVSPLSLAEAGLSQYELIELFESQALSRQLDLHARRLQAMGEAFYTIGSAGHEGNAAIAKAFAVTDPSFLHYRDAAFLIQRSKQLPGQTICHDMLLSFAASSDDPISGGRHKVLGSKALNIPPQTSTIASHLPKAVGAAHSLGIWRKLSEQGDWPNDSAVLCSFGDASFNHSTAQGALNTAAWTAFQGVPLPLVFICEDNGIGISTPTPSGWIESIVQRWPGLHYLSCNGLDLLDTHATALKAARFARKHRQPVFLHMRCVRLMGHAGSDAQQSYLSKEQISAMERMDPLLHSARLLQQHGGLDTAQILTLYDGIGEQVEAVAREAIKHPRLQTAAEVMAPIIPPKRASRAVQAALAKPSEQPQTMARLLNISLHRLMTRYPQMVMAGEDIGRKGGVYGVTQKLQAQYGRHRVIDTLLDEQSILGLAIGMAHNALLPVVEIQFLAYLHNAEDQLRGEASTLSFFSNGQYTNPMIVRIAGLGYQKGFGGHFHNDNALAVLRDIPGLVVACPSDAREAVGLFQECVRLADEEQRVIVFVEPIARYHCRDLLQEGDNGWCFADPGPDYLIPYRQPCCRGDGTDLAIVTYGNGVYLSAQAATDLEALGMRVRIIDLRWLTELDHAAIAGLVKPCRHTLIVDECRRSGSLSEEVFTALVEQGVTADALARITATDSFIPLGKAATCTLPSRESITQAALDLTQWQQQTRVKQG